MIQLRILLKISQKYIIIKIFCTPLVVAIYARIVTHNVQDVTILRVLTYNGYVISAVTVNMLIQINSIVSMQILEYGTNIICH